MKKLKEIIEILFSTKFMLGLVMLVIIGAIVCCIVGFFSPIFKYPNEDNLVITFLGALATFVVISNIAQVIEIRNETNKKMDEVRLKLELIEGYFNDSILVDVAKILEPEDPFFKITAKNIISVKHKENKKYHVEVRIVKRENHRIVTGEYEINYYEVDLWNKTYHHITKNAFYQENN